MKIARQLLGSTRKQLTADKPLKGRIRLSILVQALADQEPDKVGEAVRAALDG